MTSIQYDVAVVGAGPAGSTAAYFLARGGLRVALLDKSDFPRDKTCGDGLTLRALAVLDRMGILSQVEAHAFRCVGVTVRNSDEISYRLEFSPSSSSMNQLLILPRIDLDDILLRHAVEAGAEFFARAKVEDIVESSGGSLRLGFGDGRSLEASLAVMATGANTALLRKTGLLKRLPPVNLAARAYFENVEGLDDSILLFFDGIQRPGYGWVFPTSANSANVGCGAFFESGTPQTTTLRNLIETHPHLGRILKHAHQVGPIKGHPLRTDYSSALSGTRRVLVVGEAIGLVNPITGEGIDYAVESAELAAGAVLGASNSDPDPRLIQRKYRTALDRKFRFLFAFSRLIQHVYLRDGILDKALIRIGKKPHLQRLVLDACYGQANPVSAFSPRTVWDLLMP